MTPVTDELTLAEAIELTMTDSPVLSASGWQTQSLEGRIRQASLWPNPEVAVEMEEFGIQRDWGFREADFTLEVQQQFPIGGRVARKVELERAGLGVARSGHQVTVLEVVAGVHEAFIRAVAARERLRLAQESLEVGQGVLAVITARVEGGNLPPADVFRAEADLQAIELEIADAVTAEETARLSLASFWGGDPGEVRVVVGALTVDGVPSSLVGETAPIGSPHLDVVEKQVTQAKQRIGLEAASGVPDLSVGVGYRGIRGFDESALVLSVSVPLPVIDRNQGAEDEAKALARKKAYEAQARRAVWRRALATAEAQVLSSLRRHRTITGILQPSARQSHDAVKEGFVEGKFNTLDLLESRRRLVEVRRLEIDAAEQFNLAKNRVAYLVGDLGLLKEEGEHEDD